MTTLKILMYGVFSLKNIKSVNSTKLRTKATQKFTHFHFITSIFNNQTY